jgi:DinB family protein
MSTSASMSDQDREGTASGITIQEPFSGAEIVRELLALHGHSRAFWDSFSTPEFFAPLGDAWSPADNVRHLLKSNRPVLRALSTPKALLLIRFGAGLRASRTYSEVRERYFAALASGVTAGRFTPSPLKASDQTDEQRSALMALSDEIVQNLARAISGWREWLLDRLRLPHPALGNLTIREMLFFTLYHNLHHVENVARRTGMR